MEEMTKSYLIRIFSLVVMLSSLISMDVFADVSRTSNAKAHAELLRLEDASALVKPHVHTWKSSGRAIISQGNDKPSDFFQIMVR